MGGVIQKCISDELHVSYHLINSATLTYLTNSAEEAAAAKEKATTKFTTTVKVVTIKAATTKGPVPAISTAIGQAK